MEVVWLVWGTRFHICGGLVKWRILKTAEGGFWSLGGNVLYRYKSGGIPWIICEILGDYRDTDLGEVCGKVLLQKSP